MGLRAPRPQLPRGQREDRHLPRRERALVRSPPRFREDLPQSALRSRRQVQTSRSRNGSLGALGPLGRRHLVRPHDHAPPRSRHRRLCPLGHRANVHQPPRIQAARRAAVDVRDPHDPQPRRKGKTREPAQTRRRQTHARRKDERPVARKPGDVPRIPQQRCTRRLRARPAHRPRVR